MAEKDIALMAHLMRRAGFGANREELERRAAKGYEATVEELLDPESQPPWEEDLARRHHIGARYGNGLPETQGWWLQRMVSTHRPLEEKMTLFWHSILCSGNAKVDHPQTMQIQIEMLRRHCLGDYRALLGDLSRDPAMIIYLDNKDNHKGAINENWGRELLELFAMGVGNYTELDVKEASRAFTGWTHKTFPPLYPYQRYFLEFEYREDDHDAEEKVFLGQRGNFNGDDILDIVVRQPATARFIARHLYNFFVADEAQVPAWPHTPPRDGAAINILADAYLQSKYDMRAVMRVLLNSDFFKDESAWYAKVKSPMDVVVGTLRLVGDYITPKPGIDSLVIQAGYMGQLILNPPSVEGWHSGKEWINSGSLSSRVNFVADRVGDTSLPGVQSIINRLGTAPGQSMSSDDFVDGCLELMGPLSVGDAARGALIAHVDKDGELLRDTEEQRSDFARRVGRVLQLIAATREYQFA